MRRFGLKLGLSERTHKQPTRRLQVPLPVVVVVVSFVGWLGLWPYLFTWSTIYESLSLLSGAIKGAYHRDNIAPEERLIGSQSFISNKLILRFPVTHREYISVEKDFLFMQSVPASD